MQRRVTLLRTDEGDVRKRLQVLNRSSLWSIAADRHPRISTANAGDSGQNPLR